MTTPLPLPVLDVLTLKAREGWSGTITLNVKEGEVVAYEITEKHRINKIR